MEALRGAMRRDMLEGFAGLEDWRAERDHLIGEHEAIVERIEANDPDAAASQLRDHVMRFYSRVVDVIRRRAASRPPRPREFSVGWPDLGAGRPHARR